MPNLQNAIKQLRKDKKRSLRNLGVRADIKTMIKKAKKSLESKEKGAAESMSHIQKMLDKAVQKGMIKKTSAARKLSRLHNLKRKLAAEKK